VALGEVSYRIIHVFRKMPPAVRAEEVVYEGALSCNSTFPQIAFVTRRGHHLYLTLVHPSLQHGQRGVIIAHAELRRFGRISGSNRWLRVPLDFPNVPSAEHAARVAKPWRRKRPAIPRAYAPTGGAGLQPLTTEELVFDVPEAAL